MELEREEAKIEDENSEEDPNPELVEFVPPKNKFKKGTKEWLRRQFEIQSLENQHYRAEYEKLKNHFSYCLARQRDAKQAFDYSREFLSQYESANASLQKWISDRQQTYAWRLIAEVSKEMKRAEELERNFLEWTEKPTPDFFGEAKELKRKFLRKFRISLSGVLSSILIGYLINLGLTALGLGWIPLVLNFLGLTNPFSLIQRVVGIGAVFSWLFAFVTYFRGYYELVGKINFELEEEEYYKEIAHNLPLEVSRLKYLLEDLREMLQLLSRVHHKPWEISEEWLLLEKARPNTEVIPVGMDIATPLESEEFRKVTTELLSHIAQQNWVSEKVSLLLSEYENVEKLPSNSIEKRIFTDHRLRRSLVDDLVRDEIRQKVGSKLVKKYSAHTQRDLMTKDWNFEVESIKDDPLSGLNFDISLMPSGELGVALDEFSSVILQDRGDWHSEVFNLDGRGEKLFERDNLRSTAFADARLRSKKKGLLDFKDVKRVEDSGIEITLRVDVSEWIDKDKVV